MEAFDDVAHLGHVDIFTDRFDESLVFVTRVYGLKLSAVLAATSAARGRP